MVFKNIVARTVLQLNVWNKKKVKIIFEKKHALKGKRHCNGEQRLDIGEYMDRAFVFDQRFVYTS